MNQILSKNKIETRSFIAIAFSYKPNYPVNMYLVAYLYDLKINNMKNKIK
jgi:hypothetical protein